MTSKYHLVEQDRCTALYCLHVHRCQATFAALGLERPQPSMGAQGPDSAAAAAAAAAAESSQQGSDKGRNVGQLHPNAPQQLLGSSPEQPGSSRGDTVVQSLASRLDAAATPSPAHGHGPSGLHPTSLWTIQSTGGSATAPGQMGFLQSLGSLQAGSLDSGRVLMQGPGGQGSVVHDRRCMRETLAPTAAQLNSLPLGAGQGAGIAGCAAAAVRLDATQMQGAGAQMGGPQASHVNHLPAPPFSPVPTALGQDSDATEHDHEGGASRHSQTIAMLEKGSEVAMAEAVQAALAWVHSHSPDTAAALVELARYAPASVLAHARAMGFVAPSGMSAQAAGGAGTGSSQRFAEPGNNWAGMAPPAAQEATHALLQQQPRLGAAEATVPAPAPAPAAEAAPPACMRTQDAATGLWDSNAEASGEQAASAADGAGAARTWPRGILKRSAPAASAATQPSDEPPLDAARQQGMQGGGEDGSPRQSGGGSEGQAFSFGAALLGGTRQAAAAASHSYSQGMPTPGFVLQQTVQHTSGGPAGGLEGGDDDEQPDSTELDAGVDGMDAPAGRHSGAGSLASLAAWRSSAGTRGKRDEGQDVAVATAVAAAEEEHEAGQAVGSGHGLEMQGVGASDLQQRHQLQHHDEHLQHPTAPVPQQLSDGMAPPKSAVLSTQPRQQGPTAALPPAAPNPAVASPAGPHPLSSQGMVGTLMGALQRGLPGCDLTDPSRLSEGQRSRFMDVIIASAMAWSHGGGVSGA